MNIILIYQSAFKMQKNTHPIEEHYYRSNLYETITGQLKKMDIDLRHVKRKDLSAADEFHVRGAEVSRELAESIEIKNRKLLDIGCGVGGPCRMLADEFNCDVTGIDISAEFIRTATKLSELTGFSDRTKFICGNATDLPFGKNTFDIVWTQHVQMNIRDKVKFYSEINRVLSGNGIFIYYDIFKKGNKKIDYPVPWANGPDISFLAKTTEVEGILGNLGFKKRQTTDQTKSGIIFFEKLIGRTGKPGPPKLGLHLLMGKSTKRKINNLLNGLKEGKIILQSGIYEKKTTQLIL